MKPFRAKQQQMRRLEAQERTMAAAGNGKQGQPQPLTPEQLVTQLAQQRMMAAAYAAQQRQAIVVACLSGILSGLYTEPSRLAEDFGDRAIDDAFQFATKVQARLNEEARKSLAPPVPAPAQSDTAGQPADPPTQEPSSV